MAVVSVPLSVVFYGFEIFVAVLQAYIFAILTQVYIEMAMFRRTTKGYRQVKRVAEAKGVRDGRYWRCHATAASVASGQRGRLP